MSDNQKEPRPDLYESHRQGTCGGCAKRDAEIATLKKENEELRNLNTKANEAYQEQMRKLTAENERLRDILHTCWNWHCGDEWRNGTPEQRMAWKNLRDRLDEILKHSTTPKEPKEPDFDATLCSFYNVNSILHPNGISADRKTPDQCPNDGTEMLPVTWKENAQDGRAGQNRLMERINELENEKAFHPAPEVREALEDALAGFRYVRERNKIDRNYGNGLGYERCIYKLETALSAPSLEAVECETCEGKGTKKEEGLAPEYDEIIPCPQRCDNGKVWVRAKENEKGEVSGG